MPSLRFFLFGAPRFERDGEAIHIPRRKTVALLAFLAATGQPHHRDTLATLFWPENDQSTARANLRRELSRLKEALGGEALAAVGDQVAINRSAAFWLDIEEFRSILAAARDKIQGPESPGASQACLSCLALLEEAAGLYTADFMAGFSLPDSPAFDEWQFFQAEDLRRAMAEALQGMLRRLSEAGEYERATGPARRWLALDPLNEAAHRELMRLYALSGQQPAALRQYQECRRLLQQELGVEPDEETTALYEDIRARKLKTTSAESPRPAATPAAEEIPPGNRYVREKLIAAGGHGEVYLGHDRLTRQPVAIKRLKPELVSQGPGFVERFVREGEALRALKHPNIVEFLDALEEDGERLIVMEYVPGGSLRDLLKKQPQLPLDQVLQISLELADALGRAHHLNLIHRDLKPENVLLAQDGAPRLTDFGVARLLQENPRLTQPGMLLGSPAYMSPEVLRGEELDARSDIWSFGVMLFEMLSGRLPFDGEQLTPVFLSILHEPVPEIVPFRRDVPPSLADLVRSMLAKDREERIPSMRQVAAALEALRAGRPGIETGLRSPVYSRSAKTPGEAPPSAIHNLPAQSTPFVGREKELTQIGKLLVEDPFCRLLTVTGPGGTGKTRLALEAASAAVPAFGDGVYFIPLAPLSSAGSILSAIAEQLHFQFLDTTDPQKQLLDYLRQKKILLVMDNFEHLLPGTDPLVEILQAAPGVKVLATSRERLNLSDEMVFTLSGLDYPDPAAGLPADIDLPEYEAVKLLVQCARRVRPGFTLQPQDFEPAARICRLVQGMPLAIVLAAGWLEALSLAEIADEISQSLDFLESQAQDLPPRQRCLRAVFNSSWSRLDSQERAALERLTVFQGSFTRQAAQAVAGASLTTLLALIHKSWLQRNPDGRYQIHMLLRQYASESLEADPSAWRQARDQHGAYYAGLLEKQAENMRGAGHAEAFAMVPAEFENLRAAWQWLISQGEIQSAVQRLLPAFFRYCEVRAKAFELLQMLDFALRQTASSDPGKADPRLVMILLTAKASFYRNGYPVRFDTLDMLPPTYEDDIRRAWSLGEEHQALGEIGFWGAQLAYIYGRAVDREEGCRSLSWLVRQFREQSRPWELAYSLEFLGCMHLVVSLFTSEKEAPLEAAEQALSEALEIFQQLGDVREAGITLRWLGHAQFRQQRWDEAARSWQAAQARLDAVGDWMVAANINYDLGGLSLQRGDFKTASWYLTKMSQIYEKRGHKRLAAYALSKESFEAVRYDDIERALHSRQQALRLSQEVNDVFGQAWSTWEMGEIFRVAGDLGTARVWFERARGLFEEFQEDNGPTFYHRGLGDLALAAGDYAEAGRQFQASLDSARKAGFQWGAAYALAGLGKAAVGLERYESAWNTFVEALQNGIATADSGLVCAVLAGIAGLYAATSQAERAVELCALIASQYLAWNETRAQAEAMLSKLEGESLDADKIAAARQRGRQAGVWETAERLLRQAVLPEKSGL